ncbi:MAG: 4Fe-4S binding protein [Proteobacteria bacterium]|nr:4Fe-4S binding protein [Pseudomonadota bacterium]
MARTRKIIEIDEKKCNGCGQCVSACAEGALELVNGKAKLVKDIYCDGLGACIGECPEGALKIIERDAVSFNEKAVEKRMESKILKAKKGKTPKTPKPGGTGETLPCGCPSSQVMDLKPAKGTHIYTPTQGVDSELSHWPIKLKLLPPEAPFLKGADLVLLADCAAAAYPNLHPNLLRGRAIVMACPKFDDLEGHINRLAAILEASHPKSLTVVIMEVPCCNGLLFAAEKAIELSGVKVPMKKMVISRDGKILDNV